MSGRHIRKIQYCDVWTYGKQATFESVYVNVTFGICNVRGWVYNHWLDSAKDGRGHRKVVNSSGRRSICRRIKAKSADAEAGAPCRSCRTRAAEVLYFRIKRFRRGQLGLLLKGNTTAKESRLIFISSLRRKRLLQSVYGAQHRTENWRQRRPCSRSR